ncbi:hypothetical protein VTO42DRAFT_7704 [Malbranchea cinnamomea]
MGITPIFSAALALAFQPVRAFPWYAEVQRDVLHLASVSPWFTNSPATVSTAGLSLPGIASSGTCTGTTTYLGPPPEIITTTITENFTVGPTQPLPPPTFITPPEPCETVALLGEPCSEPCFMPKFGTFEITKKTPVYAGAGTMTDPPTFEDPPTRLQPAHQTETDTDDSSSASPGNILDWLLSDFKDRLPNPTAPLTSSVITSPTQVTNIVIAGVPVTIIDRKTVIIETITITFTPDPKPTGNSGPNSIPYNAPSPTTTITASSGEVITVAPQAIIGPSMTVFLSPVLTSSPESSLQFASDGDGSLHALTSSRESERVRDSSNTNEVATVNPTATPTQDSRGSSTQAPVTLDPRRNDMFKIWFVMGIVMLLGARLL